MAMEMADKGIQLPEVWNKLPRSQKVALIAIFLIVTSSLIFISVMATKEKFTPLFTGMSPNDAGEIIDFLKEKGIPYKLRDNGRIIEVPDKRVYETRIELATQGLPKGGISGFEILNDIQFGATDFERRTRYYLALQGELVRTIKSIESVEDARVHIVVPEESVFLRDKNPATASVLLKLKRGAELTSPQIRAIANLVASGVEGLSWEDVTIIDVEGNDLSAQVIAGGSTPTSTGTIKTQLELKEAFEKQLEARVKSMLEQIFGLGNVVVRIFADMDFDYTQTAKVTFTPLQNPDGSQGGVRSEEIIEETSINYTGTSGGVPGTTSNIPTYPLIDDESGANQYHKIHSVSNYELNKEEQTHTNAPGKITRLTASAWVDGDLSAVELSLVEQSIAGAIGFEPSRGDVINVASANFDKTLASIFAPSQLSIDKGKGWWKDPMKIGIAVVALLFIFLLIAYIRSRRRRALDIMVGGPEEIVADEVAVTSVEEDTEAQRLRQELIQLVNEQSADVAQLIRVWLSEK